MNKVIPVSEYIQHCQKDTFYAKRNMAWCIHVGVALAYRHGFGLQMVQNQYARSPLILQSKATMLVVLLTKPCVPAGEGKLKPIEDLHFELTKCLQAVQGVIKPQVDKGAFIKA